MRLQRIPWSNLKSKVIIIAHLLEAVVPKVDAVGCPKQGPRTIVMLRVHLLPKIVHMEKPTEDGDCTAQVVSAARWARRLSVNLLGATWQRTHIVRH